MGLGNRGQGVVQPVLSVPSIQLCKHPSMGYVHNHQQSPLPRQERVRARGIRKKCPAT